MSRNLSGGCQQRSLHVQPGHGGRVLLTPCDPTLPPVVGESMRMPAFPSLPPTFPTSDNCLLQATTCPHANCTRTLKASQIAKSVLRAMCSHNKCLLSCHGGYASVVHQSSGQIHSMGSHRVQVCDGSHFIAGHLAL